MQSAVISPSLAKRSEHSLSACHCSDPSCSRLTGNKTKVLSDVPKPQTIRPSLYLLTSFLPCSAVVVPAGSLFSTSGLATVMSLKDVCQAPSLPSCGLMLFTLSASISPAPRPVPGPSPALCTICQTNEMNESLFSRLFGPKDLCQSC